MRIITIAKYVFPVMAIVPIHLEAAALCAEAVAKVLSTQGRVEVKSSGSSIWRRVSDEDLLCDGDVVHTSRWSRVTIMRPSGSGFTMSQNGTLTVNAPPEDNNEPAKVSWYIKLLQGAAFFRSRHSERFNIQTPFINAVHKGTEFLVEVSRDKAEISVYDGQVEGRNSSGTIEINKGYKGIAGANTAPQLQRLIITPEDAVQWALYYPPIVNDIQSDNATINAALTAYRNGDVSTALEKLEALSTGQQTQQYLTLKSALLLTVGRVDEAQSLIAQTQRLEPNNSEAFALQAIIAVAKNHQQEALKLAQKAVEANPKSPMAHIAFSYAYQAVFNIEAALNASRKATQLAPENALAWARVAELELSQGDKAAALNSAGKAQVLNPNLARTQTVLGFADLAQTDVKQAQQAFEKAVSLDRSDPLPRLGLGLTKIRQGDIEGGKTDLETAVNLDPNNAVTRSYLGKAYYELRNKDFAGKEFEIAKATDPKDPTPYFYDAILKQTTNRPVEALHDMQKAIDLNENRAVYRSSLLLDKDKAARQVGLGRIFTNLGFDDPAHRQAMKSLALDPGNYTAHRLLSDSYATRPRHEIARASEYLQSQLLQPLSYNPIQPSLAYTDLNIIRGIGPSEVSFNEYNRLFERDGIRFTTTGVAGSNSTLGDETALSGIYDKFSFSLGQLHYNTDGFRQNNDLQHNLYNVFAQYEVSPTVNLQTEYRHRETEHGDLEQTGDTKNNVDQTYRRKIEQDSYRYGVKVSPEQNSDLLFSFIHSIRNESTNQFGGFSKLFGKTYSYDIELQHIFHGDKINTVTGGGMYRTENSADLKFQGPNPICPNAQLQCLFDYGTTQYFGYFYSNYALLDELIITSGLSFDHYRDKQAIAQAKINELNPKFGLIWKPFNKFSFRGAVFKSVKSAIVDNQILQPSQIAGFNQYFDDLNGTVAWQYGLGLDTQFNSEGYAGIEAYKRDLKIPKGINVYEKAQEELYRLYINWTPLLNVAINSEFRFENFRYANENNTGFFPSSVESAYIPLSIRLFYPEGFFAELKGTYVNQKVNALDYDGSRFKTDFYLVDAAIGYRFPKQYGLISFEAKNLFDTNFRYRDRQFQLNEQRTPDIFPERLIFARVTFNF